MHIYITVRVCARAHVCVCVFDLPVHDLFIMQNICMYAEFQRQLVFRFQ